MNYTKQQMLTKWRSALGIDTIRSDMTIQRTDGIDIDTYITQSMRDWYLGLLATAPAHLLPCIDIAAQAIPTHTQQGILVKLPDTCIRVVAVQLAGWQRPAVPLRDSEAAAIMLRASSSYTTPGICEPAAIVTPDGHLLCMPATTPTLAMLTAIVDPGPEQYILHESLLKTIPRSIDPYAL